MIGFLFSSVMIVRLHFRSLDSFVFESSQLIGVHRCGLISPQNQDQLRLIQHWWWKFQMLS